MSEQAAPPRPAVVEEIMDLAWQYGQGMVNATPLGGDPGEDTARVALESAVTALAGECEQLRAELDLLKRSQREPTQLDAIKQYAEAHGGVVRVVDAKAVIQARGMSRSKNLYYDIFGILLRSDEFEKCGPGSFRYLAADGGQS